MVWDWIKARLSLLRPWELAVLRAIASKLSPRARSTFEAQLRAINKVQRHVQGREVNLYQMVGSKSHFDEKLSFQNRGPEVLLGKVAIDGTKLDKHLKAQVWLTGGHVFSITFDQPPRIVSRGFTIDSAQILVDPEQPEPPKQASLDPAMLDGKLAEWNREWGLVDVHSPLAIEEWRKRIQDLEIVVPLDYEAMMRATDGFTIAGWRVHGLSEVRSIIIDPEDTFIVLAENHGCLIASSRHPGELRRVSYDGPTVQDAGRSFVAAMETILRDSGSGHRGQA